MIAPWHSPHSATRLPGSFAPPSATGILWWISKYSPRPSPHSSQHLRCRSSTVFRTGSGTSTRLPTRSASTPFMGHLCSDSPPYSSLSPVLSRKSSVAACSSCASGGTSFTWTLFRNQSAV